MIDLKINEEQLRKTAGRAKELGIIMPTFEQMRNPSLIPEAVTHKLKEVGLWDIHPLNLFRISWRNEPKEMGGGYGDVNYLEIPPSITGVDARIFALVGKWFPTGAHKVGATYGCLAPELVTGKFDPTFHKAVWPSTGNFCRGGAYVGNLLACDSIAILPEEMSKERFDWLAGVAEEVIATPGSESNVWEIFQKCIELQETRDNVVIFNQFDQLGNHLWHYGVTGPAIEEAFHLASNDGDRFAGVVLSSGSAGTLGCGDYLKEQFPRSLVGVAEALQCPTLLHGGFGSHRIEGIGDKHIPWIHNMRNTDMVIGVDDEYPVNLIRLFNEPAGKEFLQKEGISEDFIELMPLMGISGVANVLAAIKLAKYYQLTSQDVVFTILTDSMDLYGSRLQEMREERGDYDGQTAIQDYSRYLRAISTDHMAELGHYDRLQRHNLKYFTWIEQMGKSVEELDSQWYDWPGYWDSLHEQVGELDQLINQFNQETGLLSEID
jgi:cysteine synthase